MSKLLYMDIDNCYDDGTQRPKQSYSADSFCQFLNISGYWYDRPKCDK